jgi:hypothetical protein
VAFAVVAVGCNTEPTVEERIEELCVELDASCSDSSYITLDRQACVNDGEHLRDRARAAGCQSDFEAHLRCVEDARCQWPTECDESRIALDHCIAPSSAGG